MKIENYNKIYFNINHYSFKTEDIISVVLDNKIYTKNQFNSISNFYDFLDLNRIFISYIEHELKSYITDNDLIYKIFIKNSNIHKLDGPAVTILNGKKSFGNFTETLKKEYHYFIDGIKMTKDEFEKHTLVRESKITRILKI
jgi:hypothetical protein